MKASHTLHSRLAGEPGDDIESIKLTNQRYDSDPIVSQAVNYNMHARLITFFLCCISLFNIVQLCDATRHAYPRAKFEEDFHHN